MRKKVLRKKGITLVEILLVASIMTFVGLGIYKTFTSGITVWKWIEANRPDGEVLIFFDKVSSDLRNYCDIASSDFNGSSFSVSFLVHNPEYLVVSENAQSALLFQDDAISRIEYVYIPERKEIRRKMYKYGFTSPEVDLSSLANVEEATFAFFVSGGVGGGFEKKYTLSDQLPIAVEINIKIRNNSDSTESFTKVIEIPISV